MEDPDESLAPLTVEEVFYLATKGGGEFFGRVGSLEPGYEFDAVVIDDTMLRHARKLSTKRGWSGWIYLGEDRHIQAKYVKGKQVLPIEKKLQVIKDGKQYLAQILPFLNEIEEERKKTI